MVSWKFKPRELGFYVALFGLILSIVLVYYYTMEGVVRVTYQTLALIGCIFIVIIMAGRIVVDKVWIKRKLKKRRR